MKKFEDIMKNLAGSVRLTDLEKEKMDDHVLEYIKHVPIRPDLSNAPVQEAFFIRYRFTVVLVMVAVLFTSGVGVTYASTNALPGDTLYSVKEAREEITERLILNREKKAEYAIERVHKRLQEAEALAMRGALDERTESLVTAKFERLSSKAQKHIAFLEKSNPAQAEALRVVLAVGTEARAQTLAMHATKIEDRVNVRRTRIAVIAKARVDIKPTAVLAVAPRIAAMGIMESDSRVNETKEMVAESIPTALAVSAPSQKIVTLVHRLNKQKEKLEKISKRKNHKDSEKIKEVLEYLTNAQIEITNSVRSGDHTQAGELVKEALRLVHKTLAVLDTNISLTDTLIIKKKVRPIPPIRPVIVEPEPVEPFDESKVEVIDLPNRE